MSFESKRKTVRASDHLDVKRNPDDLPADSPPSTRVPTAVTNEVGRTRVETVLFDVDGTLMDTNYWHVAAWTQAFDEVGRPLLLRKRAVRLLLGPVARRVC